jgi:hypothetical protein
MLRIWFNIIDFTPETSIKISTDIEQPLSEDTNTKLEQLLQIQRQLKQDNPSKLVSLDAIEELPG